MSAATTLLICNEFHCCQNEWVKPRRYLLEEYFKICVVKPNKSETKTYNYIKVSVYEIIFHLNRISHPNESSLTMGQGKREPVHEYVKEIVK